MCESIWDVERDTGRREILIDALRASSGFVHLDELAISMDRLARENNGDLWLSTGPGFHNSRFRRILSRDIDFINRAADFPYVIISANNGVKIASKTECEEMMLAERKEAVKKLAKVSAIANKYNLDGQLTITADEVKTFKE